MIGIRLITPAEIPQAKTLMKKVFEIYLRPIFFLDPSSTLVALQGDQVVGGINLKIFGPRKSNKKVGYIGFLYVDPAARNLAVGSSLLREALRFLHEEGCSEITACVEGDNPSSFKLLAHNGFSQLSLGNQLSVLGLRRTVQLWYYSFRFFDMGYFVWHKGQHEHLPERLEPTLSTQSTSFFLSALLNLMWFALAFWRSAGTLSFNFWLLFPLGATLIRTGIMALVGSFLAQPLIYLAWDSAHLPALLLALFFGWPLPVPGNLYPRGINWQRREQEHSLSLMALAALGATWVLLLLLTLLSPPSSVALMLARRYTATLLLLDTLFFFYPFSGFNASRLTSLRPLTRTLSVILTLLLVALPLFTHI